ncbi:hypothetical protein F4604DRAFT_1673740 [Suillus subluteus]|nr:hypothetical protein F4604DRAFT_1673740 [Suillus subluteus]
MSSNSDTLSTSSNDSRSSDFNDGSEAILAYAESFENRSNRSTPESHWGCTRYHGHRQGAPEHSCGCYKHNVTRWVEPEPLPADNEQAFQLADEFGLGAKQHEQLEPQLEAPSCGLEDTDESRRKRKRSEDDSAPSNFSHDVTNIRATSVPVIELWPEKRRKIGRNFELFEGGLLAKVMQEVMGYCNKVIGLITMDNVEGMSGVRACAVRLYNDIQLLKDGEVLVMLRDSSTVRQDLKKG